MTIKSIYFFFLLLPALLCDAQNALYDVIKPGHFPVGFKDTIVFDSHFQYEAFDYKGPKPHFIKIWFPVTATPAFPQWVTVKDFFETNTSGKLATIQAELEKNFREMLIRDFIKENPATGELNDYGNTSHDAMLGLLGAIKTNSFFYKDFTKAAFPVIVYHHGSQSFSFENFAMAEYFASRGFIVVASGFHLPYEETVYGLKPLNRLIKNEEEHSLKTIVKFAASLTRSKSVFFIGHSWGAQMGLRSLDNDTTIKAFVSLETTIEFKTDHEKIKEFWPEVYQKLVTEKAAYPFPILFCAATGEEKPFAFFENVNVPEKIFVSTKKEFEHNAYLSVFYLRLLLANKVNQPDKEIMQNRLALFIKHLALIETFIDGALTGKKKLKHNVHFIKDE